MLFYLFIIIDCGATQTYRGLHIIIRKCRITGPAVVPSLALTLYVILVLFRYTEFLWQWLLLLKPHETDVTPTGNLRWQWFRVHQLLRAFVQEQTFTSSFSLKPFHWKYIFTQTHTHKPQNTPHKPQNTHTQAPKHTYIPTSFVSLVQQLHDLSMLHKSQNFVDERPLILGQTCKTDTFAYCGQHNKSETKSYQNILQKLRRIICIAFVAKRCNSETKKRQTEIIKNFCKNSDLLAYLRNRCRSNSAFPRGHLHMHLRQFKNIQLTVQSVIADLEDGSWCMAIEIYHRNNMTEQL